MTPCVLDFEFKLISRMLPLISVITPATLTVRTASQPSQTIHNVPISSIDYGILDDQTFAYIVHSGGYTGSTQRVLRLVASITSQG